jgi:hypothetical protein
MESYCIAGPSMVLAHSPRLALNLMKSASQP